MLFCYLYMDWVSGKQTAVFSINNQPQSISVCTSTWSQHIILGSKRYEVRRQLRQNANQALCHENGKHDSGLQWSLQSRHFCDGSSCILFFIVFFLFLLKMAYLYCVLLIADIHFFVQMTVLWLYTFFFSIYLFSGLIKLHLCWTVWLMFGHGLSMW